MSNKTDPSSAGVVVPGSLEWKQPPGRDPAPLAWARKCYGVVVDGDQAVVVRAERTRSDIKFFPVSPNDSGFAADLARGVPVVACMGARESFVRWIEAPLASQAKARKVLPTLLDIQLPFVLEDCVYTFLRVGSTRRRSTRALAVATRKIDLQRNLAALAARGWDPRVLDQEGIALWTQSLHELPPDVARTHGIRAVVHLGANQCTLVLGRGLELLSVHVIRGAVDAGAISRLLRTEMKAGGRGEGKAPEPATGEAALAAGAETRNQASREVAWVWTGPGARDSQIVERLYESLRGEWPGPSLRHKEPDALLARAVALRALLPGDFRCNLRQGDFVHPAEQLRQSRHSSRFLAVTLVSGLLLGGVSIAAQGLAGSREGAMDRAFGALRDRLLGYSLAVKGQKAIATVRTRLQKDTKELQPFLRAVRPVLAERVAAVIALCGSAGLKLDSLSMGTDSVSISGLAPDWKACDAVVRYLGQAGYVVQLDRQPVGSDGRIPFTVNSGGGSRE